MDEFPFLRKHLNRCLCIVRCVKSKAPGRVKTLPYKSPIKIPFANSIAHRRELW